MLIGFFDSGIGGVTVLHEAAKTIKNADFLYYGDTKNVPYGTKTKEQVKSYVRRAADFLVDKGVDVLVVACNTATSVAIEDLRHTYRLPIIGMEPAVKPAVENHKDKRVLVTATPLALREEKLKKLITRLDAADIVNLLPLPELVRFAEAEAFDSPEAARYLETELSRFDLSMFKTVVLGCTHFIYFRPLFKKLLGTVPDIDIIDGNRGTVNMLVKTLDQLGGENQGAGCITYYHSGVEVTDVQTLDRYKRLLERLDNMENL
jgi:glutamate racemase